MILSWWLSKLGNIFTQLLNPYSLIPTIFCSDLLNCILSSFLPQSFVFLSITFSFIMVFLFKYQINYSCNPATCRLAMRTI